MIELPCSIIPTLFHTSMKYSVHTFLEVLLCLQIITVPIYIYMSKLPHLEIDPCLAVTDLVFSSQLRKFAPIGIQDETERIKYLITIISGCQPSFPFTVLLQQVEELLMGLREGQGTSVTRRGAGAAMMVQAACGAAPRFTQTLLSNTISSLLSIAKKEVKLDSLLNVVLQSLKDFFISNQYK